MLAPPVPPGFNRSGAITTSEMGLMRPAGRQFRACRLFACLGKASWERSRVLQLSPLWRTAMKPHAIMLTLLICVAPSTVLAQSSGGGSSVGSSAGGAASGPSAAGSPSAGSAGAGSLGTNGVPPGPANSAGLNNAGNDPSGVGNAPRFNSGTTTGVANPSQSNRDVQSSTVAPRGTNSAGTAQASGQGGGGRRSAPTRTSEQGTDAVINAENRRLNHALNSICRGC